MLMWRRAALPTRRPRKKEMSHEEEILIGYGCRSRTGTQGVKVPCPTIRLIRIGNKSIAAGNCLCVSARPRWIVCLKSKPRWHLRYASRGFCSVNPHVYCEIALYRNPTGRTRQGPVSPSLTEVASPANLLLCQSTQSLAHRQCISRSPCLYRDTFLGGFSVRTTLFMSENHS